MYDDIREFITQCDKCQRMNPKFVKSSTQLHHIPVQPKVWNQVRFNFNFVFCYTIIDIIQVGIDPIGPLPLTQKGNKYVATLVEYFSKWPEAAPLPDKSAIGVGMFLYELFCRYVNTFISIYISLQNFCIFN